MKYHLICVHPFGDFEKGQRVTDPNQVADLLGHRDHHFVRVVAPDDEPAAAPARAPAPSAEKLSG